MIKDTRALDEAVAILKANPNLTGSFDVTVGEGVLDEDGFLGGYVDEVYGKLLLTNLYTTVTVTKTTNVVSHRF